VSLKLSIEHSAEAVHNKYGWEKEIPSFSTSSLATRQVELDGAEDLPTLFTCDYIILVFREVSVLVQHSDSGSQMPFILIIAVLVECTWSPCKLQVVVIVTILFNALERDV
jgi:hypothetical protein